MPRLPHTFPPAPAPLSSPPCSDPCMFRRFDESNNSFLLAMPYGVEIYLHEALAQSEHRQDAGRPASRPASRQGRRRHSVCMRDTLPSCP